MKREAKEKYAEISEAIEQAEKAELDRILDDIASGSKKRLIRIRNNESDIEMIYLRCRRIAIVLEYFRFRTPKQNAVLKKDCDDVIKMIAFNEYRLNTDKANVFEAADCVLALSDGGISKKDVVGVFSKQHPNDGTIYGENNEELPDRTFEEAGRLAGYYSSGRTAPKVEIDYIQKKHVKKPNGSKPGFVVYYTNYSLIIEPDISGIQLVEE